MLKRFPHERPIGSEQAIRGGNDARELQHLRVDGRLQETGEVAVRNATEALRHAGVCWRSQPAWRRHHHHPPTLPPSHRCFAYQGTQTKIRMAE
jgi:hypothetical protein